jgi:G3E family GTPase
VREVCGDDITLISGPIASIFWLDEDLESDVYLDGVVTLVDAKYIKQVGR